MPYTYSYIIRKRGQVDGLNELPKDKRPPEYMIWDGGPEEIEDWLDKVMKLKEKQTTDIIINTDDIED